MTLKKIISACFVLVILICLSIGLSAQLFSGSDYTIITHVDYDKGYGTFGWSTITIPSPCGTYYQIEDFIGDTLVTRVTSHFASDGNTFYQPASASEDCSYGTHHPPLAGYFTGLSGSAYRKYYINGLSNPQYVFDVSFTDITPAQSNN